MGYTTDFSGSLSLSRDLTVVEYNYINKLSETRRMKRDVNKLMELYKGKNGHPMPESNTPEGIYGIEGEYFVKESSDVSIIDSNSPPTTQPGLYCQWVVNEYNELEWDGGEKFYNYIEWLKYLINHFFSKWGVLLNGEITWQGEETGDVGMIKVVDNKVTIGKVSFTFD